MLFHRVGKAARGALGWVASFFRAVEDPDVVEEQRRVLLERARVACWIALTLLPFTILLYLARYQPARLPAGLVVTAIADGSVVVLQTALRRGVFNRHFHLPFFLLMGVICNLAQATLLQLSGGGARSDVFFPYFLIFFGMATIFPASAGWTAITCATVVATYPVAELLGRQGADSRAVIVNSIRLLDYAFITMMGNRVVMNLFVRERRSWLDLAKANERLRELDRAKSDFFATISHELRTPLTLILAPLGSLLEGPGAGLGQRERELLETVRGNAARLLALINDLLLLTRFDMGRVERRVEPVDVTELCEQIAEAARPHASQLGLRIEVEADGPRPTWYGDRRHLERVLLNLVSNACKFSHAGSRVRLRVEQDETNLTIAVSDEGVGIAPADRERIFERFFQVESRASRRFEGTGIGLAVVKELVRLHGGRVSVESEPGRGSTFRVHLPRATGPPAGLVPPSAAADATDEAVFGSSATAALGAAALRLPPAAHFVHHPREGAPPGSPSLLVVEDNVGLLEYLAGELESEFRVTACADATDALRRALDSPPDLVLADVMMPLLDGIELCRRLRADSRTREVPVILLSARGDTETKLGGFAYGADDYVQKPFNLSELRARIRLQLRLRAQAAALAARNQELQRLSDELARTLRRLQEAQVLLVQNEKLATLGTVVAGVAHEINNPLHFVQGNLALLRRLLPPRAESSSIDPEALFQDLRLSLERIANVTRELQQVARRESDTREDIDLSKLLDLLLKLLSARSVQVTRSLDGVKSIRANAQGMFQVLANLLQNAIQAVGGSGRIEVAARRLDDGSVAISVRDNGPGIAPEHLGHIFEPFFTTKPADVGTGLGLSIVERIVTAHGGTVSVKTDVGRGSEFTVRLPQPPDANRPRA